MIPIQKAHELGRRDLVTLDASATFESLVFMRNEVALYTVDGEEVEQDMVVVRTSAGDKAEFFMAMLHVSEADARALKEHTNGTDLEALLAYAEQHHDAAWAEP
ncbi:Hypothetical protein CAP_3763 [Chondromyces apiculatus DSM 436]|uniref:Uncharacterized protein n=2 Tax=Chondromyces apiculatus TaxID=51 RepID=A0A017T7J0_9BACT|nr:Hypothetical protein CAP_3763 [Chondromyces apiculatus DSM 436]